MNGITLTDGNGWNSSYGYGYGYEYGISLAFRNGISLAFRWSFTLESIDIWELAIDAKSLKSSVNKLTFLLKPNSKYDVAIECD